MSDKKFKIFDSDSLKKIHKRVFLSISIFVILFSIIFIRISNTMIFLKYFDNKLQTNQSQAIERGKIFDRNGVLLASTIKSYSLFAHPKKIKNVNKLSDNLEKILLIPNKKIKSKLLKNTKFVWLKRNISPRQHQQIINLGNIGLQTKIEKIRLYPHNNIISHVVGFTNIDGKGLSGIESGLDNKLSSGEDVQLSIDIRLQDSVRNEMITILEKFSAESGLSIILDITNGEILSMVSYPDFNPNFLDKILPENQFNSATQGVYDMGSTFKPLTVAIGYDKKIINSNMLFDVSKPIKFGKYSINDYSPYKGKLDVKDIIVKSSNIGAAKIAKKIGKENQIEYFKKFGFFDKIDLEINETAKPLVPQNWKVLETMTIGYGYGFAITPLHLCKAYASIVNDGFKVYPTLLINRDIMRLKKIVNTSTSKQVTRLLRSVVLETKYTGPLVKINGYELGGKTGTAELLTNHGYSSNSNLASFISIFPISKPKYLVLAMIKDPKKIKETNYNNTGGWVAAPLVKKIILNMIKIYGIPSTSEKNILKASNDKFIIKNKNATF